MADATIFNFGSAQTVKQLKQNRQALLEVLENIRGTLHRLFETGIIYHFEGSRSARSMLEAQELLTGVLDAIDTLQESDDDRPDRTERVRALHETLQRVGSLTNEAAVRLKNVSQKQ